MTTQQQYAKQLHNIPLRGTCTQIVKGESQMTAFFLTFGEC